MSYSTVRLGDIATVSSSKRIFARQYVPSGIPFYRQKEIIEKRNKVEISDPLFISKETFEDIKGRFGAPQKGDLLITAVGVTLGIPYVVGDEVFYFKDGNLIWLKDFVDGINSTYLYYWITSDIGQKSMWSRTIGSAQPALTIDTLKQFEIPVPEYETQCRIADILSAYDALIDNNQNQMKLLEEAAQRLYKEWFVDLHFPGYEDTSIAEGVPEGWHRCSLGDIDYILESGSRPKGGIDASLINGVPSIGAENVIGLGKYNFNSEKLVTRDFFSKMTRGKLKDRDILIYKDGAYIGRTSLFQDGFPHVEASVNEHVFLLHSKEELLQYYLFFTLYQHEYYLKMQKLNKNAAQPGINQTAIASLPLLIPTEQLLSGFDRFTVPIMHRLFDLAKQNRYLELARDCLLPKLMSGEIEV